MTKVRRLLSCLVFVFMFLPVLALADEAAELKKKIMFDQKKLIVLENMKFTDEESKFFWPVYGDLQKELFAVNQRLAKLILAYAASYQTLTDGQAKKIMAEYFAIQKNRIGILDNSMRKLAKGLPAKKVFRYLQVENKLEAMARYELAKEIPLAR